MRVQYIGPGEAILAGQYIQSGEVRDVSAPQLAAAQIDHPTGFMVLDAPTPAPPAADATTPPVVDRPEPGGAAMVPPGDESAATADSLTTDSAPPAAPDRPVPSQPAPRRR